MLCMDVLCDDDGTDDDDDEETDTDRDDRTVPHRCQ